ncbi:MAG: type II toxin-antitoxin system RelE/ParE family toxin [Theionarchaea archaeon]|nr:type II toxin-antitoxin system RelE/ParE family toxin [Theionarchaea archaeon]
MHREATNVLRDLDDKTRKRIKENLSVLEEDPYHKRSGADIKRLVGANPVLYRLRVGNYRVVYAVEGDTVWITEVFHRSKGYL